MRYIKLISVTISTRGGNSYVYTRVVSNERLVSLVGIDIKIHIYITQRTICTYIPVNLENFNCIYREAQLLKTAYSSDKINTYLEFCTCTNNTVCNVITAFYAAVLSDEPLPFTILSENINHHLQLITTYLYNVS